MIQKIKNSLIFLAFIAILFTTNSIIAQDIPYHPTGQCTHSQTHNHLSENKIEYSPKTDVLYNIRDKFLALNTRGKRYIEQYYYVSNVDKNFTKLSVSSLYDIVNIMPYIYTAFDNIQNTKYTGVIVNTDLKNKLIDVLNAYKELSSDSQYISIIDNLIADTKFIENKNREQVIDFMNK